MAKKHDFKTLVFERSKRIVKDANTRHANRASEPEQEPVNSSALLQRIFGHLPEGLRRHIRAALGPDPRSASDRHLIERARQQMTDVSNREAILEATRRELIKREVRADEQELELRAQRVELESRLIEAERAATLASNELRVPLNKILFDTSDAPRPIRAVNRLAASIKRFGQLTPIVVKPALGDRYTLVTGYRRMVALKAASCTHVLVRVVRNMDESTAAALYAVENCLVDGISSNAVKNLAARIQSDHPLSPILELIKLDDENAVESLYLEDMAEEANHALAEGAAWVAALRPYWSDLDAEDRIPLEQLIVYFSKVAKRLK